MRRILQSQVDEAKTEEDRERAARALAKFGTVSPSAQSRSE